jgi:hypothetical protein
MLHQLLQLLPTWLTQCVPFVLVWGTVVGGLLWLLGARFSRAMLTLIAVTAGSWIGVRLPDLFGWTIDPVCVGVVGSIVLGTAAFLFHRTLIGVGLGAVVALWAVAAVWIRFDGPDQRHPADLHWTGSAVTFLTKVWQSFPGQLGTVLPYAFGAGLASGVLIGVLWPRFGRCLLYSLIGSTLALATGISLVARQRPDWLEMAPQSGQAQLLILLGFVAVGVAVQRWLIREPRKTWPKVAASGVAKRLRPSGKDLPGVSSPVRDAASGSLAGQRMSPVRRETLGQYAPAVPVR